MAGERTARIARAIRYITGWSVVLSVFGSLSLVIWGTLRGRPQDLPWTQLDLGQSIGAFTGRKLTALTGDAAACRTLLARSGVQFISLPTHRGGKCGYDDAVRLTGRGARTVTLSPANVGMACPVAAALVMWEWDVVAPAARRHFDASVQRIDHFGSFSCRRLYGRDAGAWSEHATGDAIDIAAFRLSDGTRISVARDWNPGGKDGEEKAAFLREVRDGACQLFATVLSPDYNAAHRDHFHLDQAERGAMGWRACR